jgi:hypothetical protein
MVEKRCWFYDDNAGGSVGAMRCVDHRAKPFVTTTMCVSYLFGSIFCAGFHQEIIDCGWHWSI